MHVSKNGAPPPRGQQGRPEVTPARGEDLIRFLMEQKRDEIKGMFARDDNPDASVERAIGLAIEVYRNVQSDSTVQINERSVVTSALYCFQRKLDPGTDVYFIPRGGKVTPQTSPQGLINLAMRSGMVLACNARFVFQKEVDDGHFDHMLGSEQWVKHKKGSCARPLNTQQAYRDLAFTYAVIDLKGGGQIIEVHDKGDIEYHRSLSDNKDNPKGLWGKFPVEAARKAVLKQALNRAPKQAEVSMILAQEAALEAAAMDPGDDFWKKVDDRIGAGDAPPQGTKTTGDAPKQAATAHTATALAGDPAKIKMPGKAETAKLISDADPADLAKWEGKIREALDSGELDKPEYKWKATDLRRLATIRARMRALDMVVTPHEVLDVGVEVAPRREPNPEQGELTAEQEAEMFTAGDNAGYAD
jgi:recombinational DNA repair protein RecT